MFGNLDISEITSNSISFQAQKGYTYAINGGSFSYVNKFTGLKPDTTYTITVKKTSNGKVKDFKVTTLPEEGNYGTGLNDKAKFIMKIPSTLDYFTSNYGFIGENISRNKEDNDFYKDDGGFAKANGYVHIKNVDGERMLEIKNNGLGDGKIDISLTFGDKNRNDESKGFSKGVYTKYLSAFAIRLKITGAKRYDSLALDVPVEDVRTRNADVVPVKFINKTGGKISNLKYDGGINLSGNLDGWLVIPFDSYMDFDDINKTSNLDYLNKNIKSIKFWQRGEAWENVTMYVGSIYVIENETAFAAAHAKNTGAQSQNSSSSNSQTTSSKPSGSTNSNSNTPDSNDNNSNGGGSQQGSTELQGNQSSNGGGYKVTYEYYIPTFVWFIVAGVVIAVAAAVVAIVLVMKKKKKLLQNDVQIEQPLEEQQGETEQPVDELSAEPDEQSIV